MSLVPGKGQIKLVSHKFFSGIMDKNNTVQPMVVSEAREILKNLGYQKIKEQNENGCIIEIWEIPKAEQTKS